MWFPGFRGIIVGFSVFDILSEIKLPLPTEDIIDLLHLAYFQYNGKHCTVAWTGILVRLLLVKSQAAQARGERK